MDTGDSRGRHEFGFRHGGDADSDGSCSELAFRDLGALCELRVRAKGLATRFHLRGHAGDVRFERVQV